MFSVWTDQGGTFTDIVRVDDSGRLTLEKVSSAHVRLDDIAASGSRFRCGTTVATNALLESRGVPTLLLTTSGFGDLPWIGDQTRSELFALDIVRIPPLCSGVVEVAGRIDASGRVLRPASVDESDLRAWFDRGVRSVAIVLVHGASAPDEERSLEQQCRRVGFTQISLGHEVAPSRGYLARLETTLADAALSPLLPRSVGHYMRSDGGLAREDGRGGREWRGCHAVLSGPAGGVVAAADLARREGLPRIIGFDMGGTSTDVSRVEGDPERTDVLQISGQRLRIPAIRLETVAAGGGSLLQVQGGLYTVGPRSAGSEPGPACYGRGGPAALTDAEAVLGRLPGFPSVCGPDRNRGIDVTAARRVLRDLDPSREVEAIAEGFRAVAHETMASAIRRLAAARGRDPSNHALVAFGGAGPGHACGVARRLGIDEVWIPRTAGVFSAVGIGIARRRTESVVPIGSGGLRVALAEMGAIRPFEGRRTVCLAARHRGTSECIEIALDEDDREWSPRLRSRFDSAHERRFGFVRPEAMIEQVELRLVIEEQPEDSELSIEPISFPPRTTSAYFGRWMEVPLRGFDDADGLRGPALVRGPGCTVVIDPGWSATLHPNGMRLSDAGGGPKRVGMVFDPIHTAVLGSRLMGIAEQMGERLARLARSVSIRERRDFSCAIFDGRGQLVCNAPHIPVHLGAMGETVRSLVREQADRLGPGQHWCCNDPYAGGSHLPDITVMSPVFWGDATKPALFVASRGHHIDVGGSRPGSMPAFSTHIDEEGVRIRHHRLVENGRFTAPDLPGCREPEEVRADLEAQVAAGTFAIDRLEEVMGELGGEILTAQMGHLMSQAEQAVKTVLEGMNGIYEGQEVLDDGTTISVRIDISGSEATVRIRAPRSPGNLNAPQAVARAAILYVFRCLVEEPLPLNEGALRPFTIDIERGGLFRPEPPAAVAGGNVESSQRLVDALLAALGVQAGSQGTMNNLTIGMTEGTVYETIGGGSGATRTSDGSDAVQVHMTNTPATDVEELEHRIPIVLESWSIRRGSGGTGKFTGGNGVEKTWRFLDSAEVSILAGRRDRGGPGLAGGGAGAPGSDMVERDGVWRTAKSEFTARDGDRLRIRTPGGGGFGPDDSME